MSKSFYVIHSSPSEILIASRLGECSSSGLIKGEEIGLWIRSRGEDWNQVVINNSNWIRAGEKGLELA